MRVIYRPKAAAIHRKEKEYRLKIDSIFEMNERDSWSLDQQFPSTLFDYQILTHLLKFNQKIKLLPQAGPEYCDPANGIENFQ